ncbi:MAG: acyl carrier protein [Candidatus Acidiferrales bacterium]
MSNLDLLKSTFVDVIGVDPASDFNELVYGSTVGWDSVAHMALIASIEGAFDIMLPTDDVIDMSSFAKAKEIVAKHGVSLDA